MCDNGFLPIFAAEFTQYNYSKMDINQFVMDFAECFDETDANEFTPELSFKQLEEWSSLSGLGIIAMCKKKYGVKITGAEIMERETITDIYNLVMEKIG